MLPLTADLAHDPSAYFTRAVILIGLGFAIAAIGHLSRTKTLIAIGIILIAFGTVVLPFFVNMGR